MELLIIPLEMDDHCHKYPEHIGLKRKVTKCTIEKFEKINFILDWKILFHIKWAVYKPRHCSVNQKHVLCASAVSTIITLSSNGGHWAAECNFAIK